LFVGMAERKSFLLRIDPHLWSELESWAESDLRSVNGQIEYLLREAVQRRRGRRAVPSPKSQATAPSAPPSPWPTPTPGPSSESGTEGSA
jgi:hypothetical protein